jgi:hypothetical protein
MIVAHNSVAAILFPKQWRLAEAKSFLSHNPHLTEKGRNCHGVFTPYGLS